MSGLFPECDRSRFPALSGRVPSRSARIVICGRPCSSTSSRVSQCMCWNRGAFWACTWARNGGNLWHGRSETASRMRGRADGADAPVSRGHREPRTQPETRLGLVDPDGADDVVGRDPQHRQGDKRDGDNRRWRRDRRLNRLCSSQKICRLQRRSSFSLQAQRREFHPELAGLERANGSKIMREPPFVGGERRAGAAFAAAALMSGGVQDGSRRASRRAGLECVHEGGVGPDGFRAACPRSARRARRRDRRQVRSSRSQILGWRRAKYVRLQGCKWKPGPGRRPGPPRRRREVALDRNRGLARHEAAAQLRGHGLEVHAEVSTRRVAGVEPGVVVRRLALGLDRQVDGGFDAPRTRRGWRHRDRGRWGAGSEHHVLHAVELDRGHARRRRAEQGSCARPSVPPRATGRWRRTGRFSCGSDSGCRSAGPWSPGRRVRAARDIRIRDAVVGRQVVERGVAGS